MPQAPPPPGTRPLPWDGAVAGEGRCFPVSRLAIFTREEKTAAVGLTVAEAREGVWPGSAKSRGVSEGGGVARSGRTHARTQLGERSGGEGAVAAAGEASLFPRSARCVAAR